MNDAEDFLTVIQGWTNVSMRPVFRHPTEKVIWHLTPAMREQCKRNHDQTPERLRDRGGLDWIETLWVVRGLKRGDDDQPSSADARRKLLESGVIELRKE